MKICVLGSGSSGNCTLIESSRAKVLVDAGFSCKEIFSRLSGAGVTPADLNGIVITHEHSDHVKGLSVLTKRTGIPVFLTKGTWDAFRKDGSQEMGNVRTFSTGERFEIEDICFASFPVLHDAAEPVGYCIHTGGIKVGMATDLGKATHFVRESLKGSDCLILESNHDPGMLFRGPYPWWLKQRIRGTFGHLSNEDSASLLTDIIHKDLKHLVLAHISQTNNLCEMAHLNAMGVLQRNGCQHVDIRIALQDRAIPPISI